MNRSAARAPRKLVCLETYWSDRQVPAFRERSVRPFFGGLAAQLEPPLAIAHRFMDSPAQLAAYTRRKEGLPWRGLRPGAPAGARLASSGGKMKHATMQAGS